MGVGGILSKIHFSVKNKNKFSRGLLNFENASEKN
jgi:hypothetical protein